MPTRAETIVPVQNEDAQEGRDESGDSLLDTATGAMLGKE